MVSAFVLDGKGVRFRNRFVRTTQYVKSERAGRMATRGLGTQRPGGILANAFRGPANVANTSVLVQGERLLALWEGGRPHELDPDTLATQGTTDLGGVLKGLYGAYSAHYCQDPVTGSVLNFGFDPYMPRIDLRRFRSTGWREVLAEVRPRVRLRMYETDRAGVTRYLRSVPLPGVCFVHDMALTEHYAVFAATPWRIDPLPVLLGTGPMLDALYFAADTPSYFLLAPRAAGPVRVVETDPFFVIHFAGAYEDGDEVVVDFPRFAPESYPAAKRFFADVRNAPAVGGVLTRHRIRPDGTVTAEPLSDAMVEAPQFDLRRVTRDYRYSYGMARTDGVAAPIGTGYGIGRFDHDTLRTDTYVTADDGLVEPVFVPRGPDSAEDDGWILTVGYHAPSHRSRLMIFDAAHLPDGPVAEAWLPFHLPLSFHGTFTPRIARSTGLMGSHTG